MTSDETTLYNCIAHAADDRTQKWDCPPIPIPGYYWPRGAARGDETAALVSAFETIGYKLCGDGELEAGYDKVVIYADTHGEWTHAAKQRNDGHWSSKLGDWEDIRHAMPAALEKSDYGIAVHYMKRLRTQSDEES